MSYIIKIGPLEFDLLETANLPPTADASINTGEAKIHINKFLAPQVKRVALWHEVLHGILAQTGQTDHPESLLEALSFGIVMALDQNQILTWSLWPSDVDADG